MRVHWGDYRKTEAYVQMYVVRKEKKYYINFVGVKLQYTFYYVWKASDETIIKKK